MRFILKKKRGISKGKLYVLLTVLVLFFICNISLAIPPEEVLEFRGGEIGKISFSGSKHAEKGLECDTCHSDIFEMEKGAGYIKFKDHLEGNYCFNCHTPQGNCYNCHKK